MSARIACLLVGLALCCAVNAQEGKLARRATGAQGGSFVTEAEATHNLNRVETATRKILRLEPNEKQATSTSAGPAQRAAVIERLDRLFELAKPEFTYTPADVKFAPDRLTFPSAHPQRKALERLIRLGFVGRAAPLATNKRETLTIVEFGELLGTFVARLATLTHKPSTRWSPYLTGPDG